MQENKKALVLLNMGGARDKSELKMFLTNMFNDENILTIKNAFIRKMVASFITNSRLESAWKNYEKIGNHSPINPLTEQLVNKCNDKIENYKTYQVMRYTPPFAKEIISQMKKDGIKEVLLLPLYPQYSTTTTKSSLEDFIKFAKNSFNISSIETFYKNDKFNECIVNEILNNVEDETSYNLVFSAHGLPQKIVNAGDPYEKQMNEHVKILSEELQKRGKNFKSINLAYQSKVGPLKWLEPSLENMLKNFKNENVIIYPLSFIVDNSETVFELDIEYKEIAHEIGIKEYKVCSCVNDSDEFIEAIKDIIK
ncbi:ferrochelatase [Aliarcobacter butzleri]|uniref:Ferrochelatase n=1 Tax=Aliarcobacter butzleri (strain RM4018) TaxID=367737 RepID=A8ES93_ALIB4|nr:ferrochelatase [Aliarcobacter butzleri]ABV66817.1 ferrochelatase [Aliarcobacter butzleri RM4018]MCG3661857.1 ferrochelatase [Aliarcobacter butzleri]MCG3679438.1 ferrochelatase [Aliarcobacter butzleri]MDN5055058.1 ferrochelatase [Aliarcobacter butzleri]SNV25411.1 Ferrochelatase [Aliarcobacter butzleri]